MKRFVPINITLIILFVLLSFSSQVAAENKGRIPGPSKALASAQPLDVTVPALSVADMTSGITAEQLAGLIAGQGVSVMNVEYTGVANAAGVFSGGTEIIGFDSGILLTSGSVANVVGPNISDSITTDNGSPGDAQLTSLANYQTYDASILEFDFIPDKDSISFQFVFASDEYNEFVNSSFNDVFAFYVNGQNCAIVANLPVAVNSINNGNPYGTGTISNPELYINNDLSDGGGSINTELDGLTKVLTCYSAVQPNVTNHLKLAIADASDYIYDSAIFIMNSSVTTVKRPIIIIPGITASFNPSCFFVKLFGVEVPCIENLWTWTPTAENYYAPLIRRLEDAGYTEQNHYLSIFHYDWRHPLSESLIRLKDRIAQLKNASGADKVDIVAHSMGGLMARTYIQSNQYANDVARLVTLGTPNYGSAKSYPVWEGAKLYQYGEMESLAITAVIAYYMYQDSSLNPVGTIQSRISGMKILLPTQNYLYDNDTNQVISESSMHQQNTDLKTLNANLQTLYDRVQIATLYGNNHITTKGFYVKPWNIFDLFFWRDGEPNWERDLSDSNTKTDGDGTVAAESAVLSGAYTQSFDVGHGDLPGDPGIENYVLSFLGVSVAPIPEPLIPSYMLAFFASGNVNVTIIGPSGQLLAPIQSGKVSLDQPQVQTIQAPEGDFQLVVITSPDNGHYQVNVTGTGSERYTFGYIETAGAEGDTPVDIEDLINISTSDLQANQTNTYQLDYNGKADDSVILEAAKPIIEKPLYAGSTTLVGLSTPFTNVQIYDQATYALLGEGIADSRGIFNITLVKSLALQQTIFAKAAGVIGNPVTVDAHKIFVPNVKK